MCVLVVLFYRLELNATTKLEPLPDVTESGNGGEQGKGK